MKEIELIIKSKEAFAKENLLWQIMGEYGDLLPNDVQNGLRLKAEQEALNNKKAKTALNKLTE